LQSKTPPLRPNSASAREAFEALFFTPKNRGSTRPFVAAIKTKFQAPFYKILIPFCIECIEIPFIKSPIKTEA